MSITLQKNKLVAVITTGSKEDVSVFSEAIQQGINFYLCKHPFQPINQEQAGNIYFLRWLDKLLAFEPAKASDMPGAIICAFPENDTCLVSCISDSLDSTLADLLHHGANHTLDQNLSEASFFLSKIRKAFSPNWDLFTQSLISQITA